MNKNSSDEVEYLKTSIYEETHKTKQKWKKELDISLFLIHKPIRDGSDMVSNPSFVVVVVLFEGFETLKRT